MMCYKNKQQRWDTENRLEKCVHGCAYVKWYF